MSEETSEQPPGPGSPAEEAPVAYEKAAEQTEEAQASALAARLNNITISEIKALLSEVGSVVKHSALSPGGTGGSGNVTIINIAVQIGNNHLDSGVGNSPYNINEPSTRTVSREEED